MLRGVQAEQLTLSGFRTSLAMLAALLALATGAAAAPLRLAHVDDLKDRRVGALLGSAHVDYVQKTWPRATLLQYSSPADLLLAVKTGKVDAALSDAEALREILRQDDTLGTLGETLFSFPEGVGFAKENNGLRLEFNRFLADLKSSGVHADMVERWMERNVTDMPVLRNAGTGRELVVGISDGTLPYAAVKDGRLIGFEIELAERFGAALGRKVRFSMIDFSGLIAAVATRKVDMIVSALFITEERRQSIAFSDPYYEESTKVFALRTKLAAYDGSDAGPSASFLTRAAASFRNNVIHEKRYLLLWDGLKATVIISLFATLFGTLLGALVCWMRMSKQRVICVPARVFISIVRGTPLLVLLMLIFYVAFADTDIDPLLVAVIAFALNFGAYSAEIFRSGVEGVDRGQTEAAVAMGFSKWGTFLHIVLPQTVRRILPVYKGEIISLVKMTSIVGYIAVQDLTKASDIIRSRTFDAFFPLVMVAVLYFALAWLLTLGLDWLERTTDRRQRRRQAAPA